MVKGQAHISSIIRVDVGGRQFEFNQEEAKAVLDEYNGHYRSKGGTWMESLSFPVKGVDVPFLELKGIIKALRKFKPNDHSFSFEVEGLVEKRTRL